MTRPHDELCRLWKSRRHYMRYLKSITWEAGENEHGLGAIISHACVEMHQKLFMRARIFQNRRWYLSMRRRRVNESSPENASSNFEASRLIWLQCLWAGLPSCDNKLPASPRAKYPGLSNLIMREAMIYAIHLTLLWGPGHMPSINHLGRPAVHAATASLRGG